MKKYNIIAFNIKAIKCSPLKKILTLILIVFSFTGIAQNFNVSGQIKDGGMNEPLIGANVVEVDENGRYLNGTITDFNGNFIMKVSSGKAQVQVSMLGFEKQVIAVNNRARINITLQETSTQLADITIRADKIGNDGVAIRDRGVAVSRIELKELNSSMTTSVEEMLQGRLGNVDITAMSGDPGAGLNIRIRGTATLNANNNPLIVINGIPYETAIDQSFDFGSADIEKFGSLIDVAPEDIESIEVLKDAGSTAIWGSKASNGVLMIKTKRGTRSKPIFEYTTKLTVGFEPPSIPMLDGGGYAMLIAESHYNLPERNNFFLSNDNPHAWEIAYNNDEDEYWNFAQNTNWIDEITRTAVTQQHHFSVRGGGEKSSYKVSVGYQDEEGTTVGTSMKKINLGTAFDYNISSKLKFNSDIMYTRYDQDAKYDFEDWGGYVDEKSLRSLAYRKMPNMTVYTRDTIDNVYSDYYTPESTIQGSAEDMPNPAAFANLAKHKRYQDNLRAGFTLNYKISDKLTANSIITLDVFDKKTEKYLPTSAIGTTKNLATNEFSNKSTIYSKTMLAYDPLEPGGIHDLKFIGQFDAEMQKQRSFKVVTQSGFSEFETTTLGDKNIESMSAWFAEYRSLGFFANAFYKFNDKYIVSAGAKVEGNSKYSRESRWGIFPAATVAWRVSEEPFMKWATFIDDFKLRGSWGISGNAPNDSYLYFNKYNAGVDYDYLGLPGVVPENMELTALTWESIEQYNGGFSFYALKNKLNIEFDVYQKTTHDLYQIRWDTKIPTSTGFEQFDTNDGKLQNKGVEVSIDYTVVNRDDFNFSFNFNISRNKNIILELPKNFNFEYGNMLDNDNYKIAITPGQASGGFYGYEYLGVYSTKEDTYVKDINGEPINELSTGKPMIMMMGGPDRYEFQAGDAQYADRNHDGKIDELDIVYLGDANPLFMGGFGPRASYKGLTFNMFLFFRVGNKIINQTRIDTENMSNYDNQSTATNQRWRSEGDITDIPRALHIDDDNPSFNFLGSSRFVEDGSFIRFKTASLTYEFPKEITKRLNLNVLKVYITGYNMYTWTNYTGQDPEVSLPSSPKKLPQDYSRTPPSMRYTLGVSITF